MLIDKLTLDVIGLVGFGVSFDAQAKGGPLAAAVSVVLRESEHRIFDLVGLWRLPFIKRTREFAAAKRELLNAIERIIDDRIRASDAHDNAHDLLGRLLAARDQGLTALRTSLVRTSLIRTSLVRMLACSHVRRLTCRDWRDDRCAAAA